MAVDYDLVVIGSSAAGIYAAIKAARLKARVVLVTQRDSTADVIEPVGSESGSDRVLLEVGHLLEQMRRAERFEILSLPNHSIDTPHIIEQAKQWANAVALNRAALESPAVLSAMGIEVIAGSGEFYRKPRLGFVVKGRQLRSRAYLIAAVPLRPVLPDTYDPKTLQTIAFLTPENALHQIAERHSFNNLVVIGAEPRGIELTQAFTKLGFRVTLIVRSSHILPEEDPEAAYLLQAQLEAEGIQVLTQTTVTQIKQIDGKNGYKPRIGSRELRKVLVPQNCREWPLKPMKFCSQWDKSLTQHPLIWRRLEFAGTIVRD